MATKKNRQPDPARGARLKSAMQEAGFSQVELGRRVGVNEVSMWKLCSGKTVPSEQTLRGLCRELRMSPEWFLFGRGERQIDPADLKEASFRPSLNTVLNAGLREWLTGTKVGRETTTEEREFLRSIPWPAEPRRAPDRTYELALEAYREMRGTGGSTELGEAPRRGVVPGRGVVRRASVPRRRVRRES